MKIKIAIVDDNSEMIDSVKNQLITEPTIEFLFGLTQAEKLIQKLDSSSPFLPDVILMDIQMPVMDGIEATHLVKQKYPNIKVIILTVVDDNDRILRAIQAGANGYILKDSSSEALFSGIHEIMEGGAPMTPSIAFRALQLLRNAPIPDIKKNAEDYQLTKRETEVLEELSNGASYKEIADKLFISSGTVKKHLENTYKKLHVHNKVEAVQKLNNGNSFFR